MIKITKNRLTALMTLILSALALFAALKGLLDKSVYNDAISTGVFSKELIIGTFSQDLISVPAAIILAILSIIYIINKSEKTFIAIMGLTGYFFYSYGLFVTGGSYTKLYTVYMVIFMLSLYSLIYGLTSFGSSELIKYQLPKALRTSMGIFFIIIILIFTPLWLSQLIPSSLINIRPVFYSVYVFDLCLVMPFLGIIAAQLFRNRPFGNIFAGIALIKIITLILSVTIGELSAPLYGISANYGIIPIYGSITLISLIFGILYILKYKKKN
ncbi:MAG: hypothetical protein AB9835_13010 [Eubacteriales bacterium]